MSERLMHSTGKMLLIESITSHRIKDAQLQTTSKSSLAPRRALKVLLIAGDLSYITFMTCPDMIILVASSATLQIRIIRFGDLLV